MHDKGHLDRLGRHIYAAHRYLFTSSVDTGAMSPDERGQRSLMSLQPEFLFATIDYEGTPVGLSRATWHAKAGNDTVGTHPKFGTTWKRCKLPSCRLTLSFKVPAMPVLGFSTACVQDVGTLLAN